MRAETREKLENQLLKILNEFDRVCKKNKLKYFLVGGTLLGAARHEGFIPWDDDIDVGMPREDYEKFIKVYYKELGDQFFVDSCYHNTKYWLPFAKVRLKNTLYKESKVKKESENMCMWIDIFPIDYTKNIKNSKLNTRKKHIKLIYSILYNKHAKTLKDFKGVHKKICFIMLHFIPNKMLFRVRDGIMKRENTKQCDYFVNFGSQYSIEKQTHLKSKYGLLSELKFKNKNYAVPADYDYVLRKIYGDNYMKLPPKEKRVTHDPLKIVFEDGEEIIFDEKK